MRDSACVEFAGPINSVGYGMTAEFAGEKLAHRVAWARVFGPIAGGKWVLHACDNRRCINVDHLFLGTHADNMADRNAKGRQAKGERHGKAKLTDTQAAELLARARAGENRDALARAFGVSRSTVFDLLKGRTRTGLTRPTPPAEAAVVAARMRAVRARRRAS